MFSIYISLDFDPWLLGIAFPLTNTFTCGFLLGPQVQMEGYTPVMLGQTPVL